MALRDMDTSQACGAGGQGPGWSEPGPGFFSAGAPDLAPALLGCLLFSDGPGGRASGIIVETEAYTADDPASHSHTGRTPRNGSMFEEGGRAYVYFIYGMHTCFNVVSGPPGVGEAVLVRALEPLEGIGLMIARRGTSRVEELARGPARLCRALGITLEHDGVDLASCPGSGPGLLIPSGERVSSFERSSRIGISRAQDRQWRFYLPCSPFLSRRSP